MHISSYGCTWEVWRALKLELLEAMPRATLTLLLCSPNFPHASITRYTHAKHEPILNYNIKVHLTPKYFFAQINLCTCLKRIVPFCPLLTQILTFYRLQKLWNLAIICCTTEQVRGMGLFLGWRHKLLCMHVYKDLIRCKSVCDIHPGIDPYPLLARSCNR